MDIDIRNRLIEINSKFYQTFAEHFSATRQRLQPGVTRILMQLPCEANILDLGCGNGELWQALERKGHRGRYVGLDFSPELLGIASARSDQSQVQALDRDKPGRGAVEDQIQASFLQGDLTARDWERQVNNSPFDAILAFAVVHHLPGEATRLQVLRKARRLLAPGGRFIHSEWQFLNSPRLRARIQPWECIGLTDSQVDPGDYLLDWRHGGSGLRYVHHFSESELALLAEKSGFRIKETFTSDGEGNLLGLYQVWEIQ